MFQRVTVKRRLVKNTSMIIIVTNMKIIILVILRVLSKTKSQMASNFKSMTTKDITQHIQRNIFYLVIIKTSIKLNSKTKRLGFMKVSI
jgi:ribosomal protein L9